jgi:hypothetical protein
VLHSFCWRMGINQMPRERRRAVGVYGGRQVTMDEGAHLWMVTTVLRRQNRWNLKGHIRAGGCFWTIF